MASLSFILVLPTFTSLANSSNVAVTGSNTIKLDEKTENEELKSDINHIEYKSEKNSDHKINKKEEKSQENKNAQSSREIDDIYQKAIKDYTKSNLIPVVLNMHKSFVEDRSEYYISKEFDDKLTKKANKLKKLIKENNIDINDKESLVMASDDIIKVARELNYMFRTGKEDFPSKIFHGLSLSGNGKNNNLDGSKKDTGKEETGKENLG
ncbi:hypothetical protein HV819_02995 [Anaerococcus sp. AGMB00486]|uniref:Uncharacterized protein n=1 Tax=Anaerococcus faecalis TaxID=2742993 RepID=A0ABX2N8H7_9FIRM|nr:hypothetical protein [Anaerococcus faecalis]NVF10960.1 hypothetical protein [Anaerococcus faecalis]